MNKKALIIAFGIILIIGASITYLLVRKDDNSPTPKANELSQTKETENTPRDAVKGVYLDYSDEVFSATKGTRLLFFHAPWCPQCRDLDASIRTSELPDNVTIFKVDYDSNQQLRVKYGVTLQTTVVKVDESGNKAASYVAYDEPTFDSVKRALLQ